MPRRNACSWLNERPCLADFRIVEAIEDFGLMALDGAIVNPDDDDTADVDVLPDLPDTGVMQGFTNVFTSCGVSDVLEEQATT